MTKEIWDDKVKEMVKFNPSPTKPGGNRAERRLHLSSRARKEQLRKEKLEAKRKEKQDG